MPNLWYQHTTYPAPNSQGSSSSMRAELDAITAGFDMLPPPLGVGKRGFDGGEWDNAKIVNPEISGAHLTGGTLDNTVIGSVNPNSGKFTTIDVTGAAILEGLTTAHDLTVTGTLTAIAGAINGTTIGATVRSTVGAKNLIVGDGANGALAILDANPGTARNLQWQSSGKSRFQQYATAEAETGSNAGSNLHLDALADDGTSASQVWSVERSTQIMSLAKRPLFATKTPWDNGNLVNPMTLDTSQTISGTKTFTAPPFAPNIIGRNLLVNGDFVWNLRGGGACPANGIGYFVDRWYAYSANGASSVSVGQSTLPDGSYRNFGYMSGSAGVTQVAFGQRIPAGSAKRIVNKPVTVSGYILHTAGLGAGAAGISFATPNGADNWGAATYVTGFSLPALQPNTWTYFSYTIPSVTTNAQYGFRVEFGCPLFNTQLVGFADIQLEVGTIANQFDHIDPWLVSQQCAPYYQQCMASQGMAYSFGSGIQYAPGYAMSPINFQARMMKNPSATVLSVFEQSNFTFISIAAWVAGARLYGTVANETGGVPSYYTALVAFDAEI